MPETAIPAPASQTCDEWSLLDDLFVPEADIDLELYQDDSEFAGALSTQPPIPTPSVPSHAGRHHSSYARIKTEYTSSYPRYQSADYPPYQACHGFFPHGVTERDLAFLPYISSDSDVSGVTRLSIKSEYTTTTSAEYSSEFDYRLPHPWARAPSSETTVSYSSTVHQPAEHRLGSIVALAIRGSLSLDFDESALQAIERSVRLLDRQRPDDHMCA
ncbi:uncharacterized protein LOC110983276 [Acanthaster planci]|uniref:Uncharacterized protein LOC110983276 n=1 Tax=Acanthaster planci TaxID=133434 RepID=A0A8B7Z418_ACAPL|nr:uncharacterized protein LOC110983276 [Acanthaster planci]